MPGSHIYIELALDEEVPEFVARQMAAVGIIPCRYDREIGYRYNLAGQPFTVVGKATQKEFCEEFEKVMGWHPAVIHVPFYLKVSTD